MRRASLLLGSVPMPPPSSQSDGATPGAPRGGKAPRVPVHRFSTVDLHCQAMEVLRLRKCLVFKILKKGIISYNDIMSTPDWSILITPGWWMSKQKHHSEKILTSTTVSTLVPPYIMIISLGKKHLSGRHCMDMIWFYMHPIPSL